MRNDWQASAGPFEGCRVTAHFDDLRASATRAIETHGKDATVLLKMAWLSCPRLVHALSKCRRVLAVVNREDFNTWGAGRTAELYKKLPWFDEPLWSAFARVGGPLSALERELRADEPSGYAPVRVLGAGRKGGPLMHDKTVIFFDRETELPGAVWTGSMNFTKGSGRNVENAVLIEHPGLALAYLADFTQTFCASEPLD